MSAAQICIVQHAQKRPVPGDPGLTDAGRDQAETTGRFLALQPWVALSSSPLRRARQTADIVAQCCGLNVDIDDRLRERMNWAADDFQNFIADWDRATRDRSWTPPAGDSSFETGARMRAALDDYAAHGNRVLVVSHGGATIDLLRTVFGDAVIPSGIESCALTRIQIDGGEWTLGAIADRSHLDDHGRR